MFFFFEKNFYIFISKILKKKLNLSKNSIRFFFINRFFFIFFKKEWVFLRKKRISLSFFVKKRKLKVNLKVLSKKFIIRGSFFLKKKNKQLFHYNLGFSLNDYMLNTGVSIFNTIPHIFCKDNLTLLIVYMPLMVLIFFFNKNVFSYFFFLKTTVFYFFMTILQLVWCFIFFKKSFNFFFFKFKNQDFLNLDIFTLFFDELSIFFTLVILTISVFTMLFQNNYMSDYLHKERFLKQLSLFIISMIFLVLANNWVFLLFC